MQKLVNVLSGVNFRYVILKFCRVRRRERRGDVAIFEFALLTDKFPFLAMFISFS